MEDRVMFFFSSMTEWFRFLQRAMLGCMYNSDQYEARIVILKKNLIPKFTDEFEYAMDDMHDVITIQNPYYFKSNYGSNEAMNLIIRERILHELDRLWSEKDGI